MAAIPCNRQGCIPSAIAFMMSCLPVAMPSLTLLSPRHSSCAIPSTRFTWSGASLTLQTVTHRDSQSHHHVSISRRSGAVVEALLLELLRTYRCVSPGNVLPLLALRKGY